MILSYSLEIVKKSVFVFTTIENGQIDHVKITIDSFVKEALTNPVKIFKCLVIGMNFIDVLELIHDAFHLIYFK